MLARPETDEHHEYYGLYIAQVPDAPVLDTLRSQRDHTHSRLTSVAPDRELHRYQPDKWSVRDVVGHLIDTERVFATRAIHIARMDPAPLPSFEQDDWARASNASARPLRDLANELRAVREANLAFLESVDAKMAVRRGIASGRSFSVRALAWIIAGHELHHMRILRERYEV